MTTVAAASATSTSDTIMQNYLAQQAKNVAADATASASASSSTSSSLASATSASSIGSNFTTFINILTTQLKNQDPTNATDPNQFTQELVQFAGVEQQLNTNNDLQTLISLAKNSSGTSAALGYMGQYVEATTTTGLMSLQSGSAEIGYTLPSTASSATITVQNASGTTVATLNGPTASGTNYLSWNGQDSSGNQLADGAYTFSVVATNAATGTAETITDMRVLGKVTGITSTSTGTNDLSIGSISVSTANVDSVYGTSSSNMPSATAETAVTTS
jgi:flagellar basal-body rod modification protein FlgD